MQLQPVPGADNTVVADTLRIAGMSGSISNWAYVAGARHEAIPILITYASSHDAMRAFEALGSAPDATFSLHFVDMAAGVSPAFTAPTSALPRVWGSSVPPLSDPLCGHADERTRSVTTRARPDTSSMPEGLSADTAATGGAARGHSGGGRSGHEFTASEALSGALNARTTLIIRRIPCRWALDKLLAVVQPVAGERWDVLYMPCKSFEAANAGFAFINFLTSAATLHLYKALHGKHWPGTRSNKVCEVRYARIQGQRLIEVLMQSSCGSSSARSYIGVQTGGRIVTRGKENGAARGAGNRLACNGTPTAGVPQAPIAALQQILQRLSTAQQMAGPVPRTPRTARGCVQPTASLLRIGQAAALNSAFGLPDAAALPEVGCSAAASMGASSTSASMSWRQQVSGTTASVAPSGSSGANASQGGDTSQKVPFCPPPSLPMYIQMACMLHSGA
jgi:RNA recognition motif 2